MGKALFQKLKESFISVTPVTLLVLVLSFTPLVGFETSEMIVFSVCSVLCILGIALFNLGADLSMTPMGTYVGVGLSKSRRLFVLLSVCFIMGVLITVAEPDLSVLAGQVSAVMNGTLLIVTVGVGVGLFLLCAVLKIVTRTNLSMMLMFFYMMLFCFAAILIESGKSSFLPLAFDSGGVTTGPITVPFIMALGVGIATIVGGADANENSFGLVALCSVGPMLAVLILSLTSGGELAYTLPDYSMDAHLGAGLVTTFLSVMTEVAKALGLIVVFFLLLQFTILKLPVRGLYRIGAGILFTFGGLVMFLTAVSVGFMPIGYKLGCELASGDARVLVAFAFVIGALVVLAEPAVHILNKQVEEVTGGTVTKRSMMIALSAGVGISIGLSVLRVLLGFSLLYYLVPGYLVSLGLAFFVPKLYTGIAFDSGGVASGPLTSSFILPLVIGVCDKLHGADSVLSLGFGVVAMVAMTPLITIQLLGFRAIMAARMRNKIAMNRIIRADDEQIICFSRKED